MRIAIIPARGGSKRIPRKNIKDFCGQPIIAYSINAALQSGCVDKVIVSTDDHQIAEVAKEHGAEVPFIRPAELADDYTGTIPVIKDAIEQLAILGLTCSEVLCLYPTAPFITATDIQQGLEQLVNNNSTYAFSVTGYPFPIQRAIKILPEGGVEMFSPDEFNTRSQDLTEAWHDAGQFYWGKAEAWLAEKKLFSHESTPLPLPRYRVQDIDTPEDWINAELMYKVMQNEHCIPR